MTTTSTHTVKITTMGNGGAKARRAVCACGFHGVRFPFGPLAGGRTIARATERAEQDGARHVAEVSA